tara:strand:- start:13186 stop:14391 length:1206 start_codon:yes stop_codon:yes gene_type:complete
MARRTRSSTANSRASKEANSAKTAANAASTTTIGDPPVDIDLSTEDTAAMPTTTTMTPIVEYEEDLIDYDDHDLNAPNGTGAPNASIQAATLDDEDINLDDEEINLDDEEINLDDPIVAPAPAQDQPATATQQLPDPSALVYEQAKSGMIWSTATMLLQTPEIAPALGLNNVGDATTAEVNANGATYEVTWKIIAFDDTPDEPALPPSDPAPSTAPAPNALQTAAPLTPIVTATAAAPKCRFGRFCAKQPNCPFSHAVAAKLCTFVNTAQGCTRGAECEFSHEAAGVKCTRSTTRKACMNGWGCGFRHGDDGANAGVGMGGVGVRAPANAPTGPKGLKRGRDGGEGDLEGDGKRVKVGGEMGDALQGARGGRQQRGRGRGRGKGRGGLGLRVRGAAKMNAQ